MFLDKLYSRRSSGGIHTWQIEIEGNKFRTHSGTDEGRVCTSNWRICHGKGVGKASTTPEQQALKEAMARHQKKLEDDYAVDPDDIDEAKAQFFRPMLAHKYEDHKDMIADLLQKRTIVAVQPKLDGMRCIATPAGLFSRQGKTIVSAPHILKQLRNVMRNQHHWRFDGELYADKFKDDFNAIISLAKKTKPTPFDLEMSYRYLEYHIYDVPSVEKTFAERRDFLHQMFLDKREPDFRNLRMVETRQVSSMPEIDKCMQEFLSRGYEGLMVRTDSPYENQRSKSLLKYKNFQDDEFQILDITEGKGNRSGMAGFVSMKTKKGVAFTSALKGNLPFLIRVLEERHLLLGKMATVKFQNYTPDGAPRFPCVVAIRDYE